MIAFGSATSDAPSGVDAAKDAASRARLALRGVLPALAIVSVSAAYDDLDEIPRVLAAQLGNDVPIVGGTAAGAVIGTGKVASRGVSVVLVGGAGIAVATVSTAIASRDLVELVPAAQELAHSAEAAARAGYGEFACLVFAPGPFVDGEALVAGLRKGAGARVVLAGGITGDELAFDRARVFADGRLCNDRIVLAGLFTKRPIGIAARHGWHPVGPPHVVTRCEGPLLLTLDGRPALDVWLDDIRAAGGAPPPVGAPELLRFLYSRWVLGIALTSGRDLATSEFVVRAPFELGDDGVRMSASIAEGATVRLMNASAQELLDASKSAATYARETAGGKVVGGIVLACSSRIAALGDQFPVETSSIETALGAPIGGFCVYGEVARTRSEVDAFFNTTTVVVAFPR
jgi:hypothetical protein